jgi:peptidoglycan/LPS O-acetylase OafA/YrhL
MPRYVALDGWRGICAIAVALYHFPRIFFLAKTPLIRSGWLFVDFFFVLSGFVITHAYESKIKDAQSTSEFLVRRFFRLYPLHLFTFLVLAAWMGLFDCARLLFSKYFHALNLTNLFSDFSLIKIGMHLTLLQGFRPWTAEGFNIPSWSISVEFWTYLLFAICCVGLRKRSCLAQILLICSCLLGLYLLPDLNSSNWTNILRCIIGFSAGSLVYTCMHTEALKAPSGKVASLLEFAVVAEIVALLWSVPPTHSDTGASTSEGLWILWVSPLIFVQVVSVFSFEAGIVSKLITTLCRSAGNYSYSIYMDHAFVISVFKISMDQNKHGRGRQDFCNRC